MIQFSLKRSKLWLNWVSFNQFLIAIHVNPIFLLIPAVLALVASVFEMISIGLLIPTLKGVLQADFTFVREFHFFKKIITFFPDVVENRNSLMFILLVTLIFFSAALKNAFYYTSCLFTAIQVRGFANTLRKHIFERYLNFNKLFFDRHNIGYLYQVLIGHTSQIAAQTNRIQNTFYNIFILFAYLILMIIVSWKLTLFVLLAFPVLHFSLRRLIHKISKTSERFSKSYLQLSSKISNSLSCIPLMKAYTHEASEKEWFDQASDQVKDLEISMDKKMLLIAPIQEMILLCMILLLVGFMALLFVREGHGEIAGYMVFVVVLRRSMITLGTYNEIQGALAMIRGPIKEVMKVFKDHEEYHIEDGEKIFTGLEKGVEFQNVFFSYRKGTGVLKGVDLFVQKGKMTALVGATGAGKTTLINLLMRFYDASSGKILFDGVNIREFRLQSLRSKIAWVSQDMFLFNATLRTNLVYGLPGDLSEERIEEALVKARLSDFVKSLPQGLETEIGDHGVRLSSGEKQRVAIARAFLRNAEILLLDEATSALDSKTEQFIQGALDEVLKDRTSIVIAHRLSTIRHADKIIVIDHGEIVEMGSLEELLNKKGKFYDYWQRQSFHESHQPKG